MTKEELQIQIGKNIQAIREEKNIPAQEIASKCNFEKSNYSRIESGKTNTTIFTLFKISKALGVPLKELTRNI